MSFDLALQRSQPTLAAHTATYPVDVSCADLLPDILELPGCLTTHRSVGDGHMVKGINQRCLRMGYGIRMGRSVMGHFSDSVTPRRDTSLGTAPPEDDASGPKSRCRIFPWLSRRTAESGAPECTPRTVATPTQTPPWCGPWPGELGSLALGVPSHNPVVWCPPPAAPLWRQSVTRTLISTE